jgi:uncharacterized membrane protein
VCHPNYCADKHQLSEAFVLLAERGNSGEDGGIGKFFMGLGPFGDLLGLLFFILAIYFLFKIVWSFIPNPEATSEKKDSLVILKTRFAKGEITQEEYHRMHTTLMS